jgi:tRNA(Ile2) C34 agmatinyltransferase TiaS
MTIRPKPSDPAVSHLHQLMREALAAGVAPSEIAAAIVRAHPKTPTHTCPECAARLAPAAPNRLRCTACGVSISTQ